MEMFIDICVWNWHQGSKLMVASGKFATWKSRLLPIEKVGSKKKLLPGNSVVKSNFWEVD